MITATWFINNFRSIARGNIKVSKKELIELRNFCIDYLSEIYYKQYEWNKDIAETLFLRYSKALSLLKRIGV